MNAPPRDPDPLHPVDAEAIEDLRRSTLGHYEENAPSFWEGTRDHDVSQNIEALLRHVDAQPPFRILDLGCGPGRDLIDFRDRGHRVCGLEGARRFVEMAREHSGCDVLHQDLLRLDLPTAAFDGVFANASLFHVPTQELSRVLRELHGALVDGGVFFASNPRSFDRDVEGYQGARYGAYLTVESWRGYCLRAGFSELESYYRPEGRPLEQQPWFASVWRKT